MPEISRFLGISVCLYYRDQDPPHIHAEYSDYEVRVDIETGTTSGDFPPRAMAALLEWYGMHKEELVTAGQRAADEHQQEWLEPLE